MKPITCTWAFAVTMGLLSALIAAPGVEGGILVTLPIAAFFVMAAMAIVHWAAR